MRARSLANSHDVWHVEHHAVRQVTVNLPMNDNRALRSRRSVSRSRVLCAVVALAAIVVCTLDISAEEAAPQTLAATRGPIRRLAPNEAFLHPQLRSVQQVFNQESSEGIPVEDELNAFVDSAAAPYELLPSPAAETSSDDRQNLEQRIRELEEQLSRQQARDDLFADQISTLNSKKDSKPDPKLFKVFWKNGVIFETPDKNFTAHFGGRTQVDTVFLNATPEAIGTTNGFGAQNATNFRRARLRMDGTIYQTIDYVMEYDFVNSVNDNAGLPAQPATAFNVVNVPAPTDLWWQFREVPIVENVKVGLQKEPIGLEHLTSSRYLDFMERSYNQDAYTGPFNNGFTPGVSILKNFGSDQEGLLHAGIFKNTDTIPTGIFAYGGSANAGYNLDARLTYLIWNECEGRDLLHVGGSYSHRDPLNDAIRIRTRGSLRNGPGALNPLYADTGNFFASNQDLAGAELSWIRESFQLQSEYIVSACSDARSALSGGTNYGTYTTYGYYVMGSYFLTGEHREYEKKAGAFGRVVPHHNSKLYPKDCSEPHWGAWQVLARFSDLNLNDNGLQGGDTRDYTLGLNWFLNPHMKIQANYVLTDRRDNNPAFIGAGGAGAGWINGFGMRLAHDF